MHVLYRGKCDRARGGGGCTHICTNGRAYYLYLMTLVQSHLALRQGADVAVTASTCLQTHEHNDVRLLMQHIESKIYHAEPAPHRLVAWFP